MASETVRTFFTFLTFFRNPKKHNFYVVLSCCTRFLEQWSADVRTTLSYGFRAAGNPSLSERAALHVVMSANQPKSASPRSAGATVDPMYAVLASADLAVVLAVSLGAVLVAIAVIVAVVFLASRRRRRASRCPPRPSKESPAAAAAGFGRPGSGFTRSWASQPGIALNDGAQALVNGGHHHHVLQRATSSASGRQINVAFAPDVNIELEVKTKS